MSYKPIQEITGGSIVDSTILSADIKDLEIVNADCSTSMGLIASKMASGTWGAGLTISTDTVNVNFFTQQTTTAGAIIKLLEGSNNGAHGVIFGAPAALTGDRTITIPDADVTLANIAVNTTHTAGDGSDHADVATNTSGIATNVTAIALNTTHRSSDGSNHSIVNDATDANTASKIVKRDASGGFKMGTLNLAKGKVVERIMKNNDGDAMAAGDAVILDTSDDTGQSVKHTTTEHDPLAFGVVTTGGANQADVTWDYSHCS
jgi:hypothetical protein